MKICYSRISSYTYAVSILFVLALVAGCATTGDIPVVIEAPQEIYISPAIEDGVQDAVTFDLNVIPLEQTRLTRYAISVVNLAGRSVRTIEEETPRISWFRRLLPRNRRSVEPPEYILWDGRDDAGILVPDGLYFLTVRAWDNRGNTGEAPIHRIVVDNTPPAAQISSPFLLFTPNGDGRIDRVTIYQRRATQEDLWVGRIHDRYGATVREYRWVGTPDDFEWDGLNDDGEPAHEGLYQYLLSASDRAGNRGSFGIEGIELERTPRSVGVQVNRHAFSPNDDGIADTITITPRLDSPITVNTWSVEILDISGTVQRMYRGSESPGPIIFDGRGATGLVLPDGEYLAVITVEHRGGQTPRSASPTFVLDTTPPRATVRSSRAIISPDGDGRNDVVEILQSSTEEQEWTGILTDATGRTIRHFTWNGRVRNFIWDGTDTDGNVLPDGLYTYALTAEDDAGNVSVPAYTRVRLDSRPTPIRLRASATRFSPNGDGLHDSLSFFPSATVTDGIRSWTVTGHTVTGEEVGLIAAGGSTIPAEIQWNGLIGGGVLPDDQYRVQLAVTYEKGNFVTATTAVHIDTTAPIVNVTTTPAVFSPDGDGANDTITIQIVAEDASPIARWNAVLYDREGNIFITWSGSGAPRNPIRWDGRSISGELVQSAEDYRLVVEAIDSVQNAGRAEHTIPVDILVLRDGEDLRIQIASIYFVPFTADYLNLEPDVVNRNLETLDRLAHVLRRYADRSIRIEGHAVSVYWYDPVRSEREDRQVLVPLSRSRAEAIREALIERGIPARRMTTEGYGGRRPVVPHGDVENRWKSRRVEFVLQQ